MSDMSNTAPNASKPLADLLQLSHVTLDLVKVLRAQQELLATRKITLNRDAIEGLNAVGVEMANLASLPLSDSDTQIELIQLRSLARISELISSSLDLDQILDEVIDTVIHITGAERGYIVLCSADTGQLDFHIMRSYRERDLAPEEALVSRTIVRHVAQTGQMVVTSNAAEDPRFSASESIANYMLRSILCVPLKRKGVVTGVIYTDNRMRPNLFSELEQNIVTAFANQAAVAIENARLFERVRANLMESTAIRDFMDNVLTSIASGVITTDSADRITTMNGMAAGILGISLDDSIGLPLLDTLPPLFDGFARLVAEVRDSDRERTIEIDTTLPHRGPASLDLRLSPLKDTSAGVTQGVAIVVDDLTELRQRQSRLNVVRRYLSSEMVDNIREIDELELSGVEREISILFCDVRGFTTFSEKLQPEVLMETINKYLSCSSSAIDDYKGIIDKYMGDAVVGLFNTQLNPQTDHTRRALYAALALVDRVQQLHQQVPPDERLAYGIGVHTGSAILGNVGSPSRREFTAIGDAIQLAKLLQENALGNEVILSAEAYEVLKDEVLAEPTAPRKTKDFLNFTVMYRVTGLVQPSPEG
ncbi:MAG TPA: adenylate/guanylate cyclase domain-containing protein [Aggregatilineales bacterium]|nr:adenylate/guanylate cyclase domain-containing protein [Aggregatilineales bacterium]